MAENEESNLPGMECCIFRDLDKKTLNFLNKSREFKSLKKGEFIYQEGASPTGVYCIHEGHIKAFKVGSDGKEQIIYLAKPGDLIGWQQLTCEDPYSTSAVALEPVTVSHIPREIF